MDVKIALECSSKSKDIAYNFDSIVGYKTTLGHFKMSTISAKMIKPAHITSKDNILEIGGGKW